MNYLSAQKRHPSVRQSAGRNPRLRQAIIETLEERQMMTLTLSLREANGASSASVTTVGQTVPLELFATITSANNMPSECELQDVAGQIISSAVEGHAIAGNLSDANVSPFNANGASRGTSQDLNGDGNLDIGGNATDGSTAGDFFCRSDSPEGESAGTVVASGTALQFEIATVTYTVTSLNKGGTTNINFFPNVSQLPQAAAWYEEFNPLSNVTGTFTAGTPFTVSDASLIVPPTAVNDTASVIRNTPTSISVLGNDDFVVPLNKSSVTIGTAPQHGTAVPQTNGTILYTPTTGYVGSDSLSYSVDDTDGRVSNIATVTITVTLPPPPVAGAVAVSATRNQPSTIDVLASDSATSPATLVPTTVTVITVPAHGTAAAQADGSVLYTPATGYVGTDTFTYTVADTNSQTSAVGTVSITVNPPAPPTATADTGTTSAGAVVTLNVLANDTTPQGTLNLTSVSIITPPTHGTAVPQPDGTVIFTPTPSYVGPDSFTYDVADSLGDLSNAATVTLTITAAVPPVASNVTSPVLSGQTSTISVFSNISGGVPIIPGSVTIATQAADGNATVNTSTGVISYLPHAGFVGTDSFTYTVEDENNNTSNPATVSVSVGTSISSTKGQPRVLSFTDADGGVQNVTISSGTAELFFTGVGGAVVVKGSKSLVNGSTLEISSIELTGTTTHSVLSITGKTTAPVTIGGISAAGPLGVLSARSANLSGTLSLPGASSIIAGSISDATINVGASTPGRLSLITGAVTDSSLTSLVPISVARAASWNNTVSGVSALAIAAPSITSLIIPGTLDAEISLSSGGKALTSATIGTLGGTFLINGSTGSITAGSVAGTSSPDLVFGPITSFNVRTGGLAGSFSASTVAALTIGGDLTGTVTTASIKALRVKGSITGSVTVTGTIGSLQATGAISGAAISATSNITSLTAGSIDASTITAGVASDVNLSSANSAALGGSEINAIRLTGRTGNDYTASTILASKIASASLGSIATANSGSSFGLGVRSITSFTGVFAGSTLRAGKAQLASDALLSGYAASLGDTFGDFEILITG